MPANNFIEVLSAESLEELVNLPLGFDTENSTFKFSQYGPPFLELEREDVAGPKAGTYKKADYQSGPNIAVTSTNVPKYGPVVMNFKPGSIPVPDGPPIGAWFAALAPDDMAAVYCPWGMVSWLQGGGL